MTSKKTLLMNALNDDARATCHGDTVIADENVVEKGENHFRVETIRLATDAEKAKHGPDVPDSRINAEYLVLTDDEASNPASGDPGDIIKGGFPTEDPAYKVYRIV